MMKRDGLFVDFKEFLLRRKILLKDKSIELLQLDKKVCKDTYTLVTTASITFSLILAVSMMKSRHSSSLAVRSRSCIRPRV